MFAEAQAAAQRRVNMENEMLHLKVRPIQQFCSPLLFVCSSLRFVGFFL